MSILFWGLTLGTIGKVLLAAGVIMAHTQLEHEHRIDARVVRTFHRERIMTLIGVLLILLGYGLEIYFYGYGTELLGCHGSNCAAAVGASLLPRYSS